MYNKHLCSILRVFFKATNCSCLLSVYSALVHCKTSIDFTVSTSNWLQAHLQRILRAPVDFFTRIITLGRAE